MTGLRVVVLGLLLALLAPLAWSQDGDENPPPSAGSQEVDEEEAEFRRRMEMDDEDEDYGDLTRPDIVDVDPAPIPDDPLPPESREHLEEQMRELIMETGRWEPADAQREAPYEPSEAAQADPALEALEQEEWSDMVEQYHEREAAAAAQAGGAGQGAGSGSGEGSGAGSGSGSGSGAGSGMPQDSPSAPGGNAERPPEGEPFSALDFLRDGGDVAPDGPSDRERASGEESDQPGESRSATNPGNPSNPEGSAADASAPDSSGIDQSSAASAESDTPSGAAAAGEGGSPDEPAPGGGAVAAESGEASSTEAREPPGDTAPDQRLSTQDLSVLFPDQETAAPNGPAPEAGTPPGDPADATPGGVPPETPSTGFLAWLQGLFAEDPQVPEPEDDRSDASDPDSGN